MPGTNSRRRPHGTTVNSGAARVVRYPLEQAIARYGAGANLEPDAELG